MTFQTAHKLSPPPHTKVYSFSKRKPEKVCVCCVLFVSSRVKFAFAFFHLRISSTQEDLAFDLALNDFFCFLKSEDICSDDFVF